jgi:NHLM bacteriocin system ABC transporter ATP-binding protein
MMDQSEIDPPDSTAARRGETVMLDPRRPRLLDDRDNVLEVKAGHVDIFVIDATNPDDTHRRHLFRIENGDIILDLQTACGGGQLQIVAVGGPGAEAISVPRTSFSSVGLIARWIAQLTQLLISPGSSGMTPEVLVGEPDVMQPGERRRGPMRSVAWARIVAGTANFLGLDPALGPPSDAGDAPIPLIAGLWIEAGKSGCEVRAETALPDASVLWPAIDRLHLAIVSSLERALARIAAREQERLSQRIELSRAQTLDAFQNLAETVAGQSAVGKAEFSPSDPLVSSCRIVGSALGMPTAFANRPTASGQGFQDILEIARTARLRVRRVQLRDRWWNLDVGPLIAWHGPQHHAVALIRNRRARYTLIDAGRGLREPVGQTLAGDLATAAASLYPALPSRALRYRDLLTVSITGLGGSLARTVSLIVAMGLLSLIPPLITNFLVNSVIPRTEIDQLIVCALALVAAAVSMASLQTMQGMVMLRLESLIDYKLQAALIDRLLRLPAALFRSYTTGDLVDRSMGIDAVRKILTGRALRGLIASLFGVFSIGLMFYYDLWLGVLALLLTLVRAVAIMAASGLRIYYESRQFNLQGKVGGLVLQLIAGVGKLRVANATSRAFALWSRQFAVQKSYFIASQRVANLLGVFETSYPTLATMVIFAVAAYTNSKLLLDLGAFLGFNSAFGQTMAAVGSWASSVSESLVAIPHLTRLKPLLSAATEVSDERRSPGQLAGEIELSGVTFRYAQAGAPVLDDVSLKIAPGEYVAIVGPSGSGKSSLLRLMLGFEKPESGAVFYDGKALNTLDISAVRRQLGVVLQDTKLASGSLYDNICGGIELPLETAWEAARLAALDTDISQMPMGMHTLVAEGVNTLSGGQRQRLMIARAIARSPRILLFDEATSALDNQTQAVIAKSLEQLSITRLVIAHRLSTVRNAHRIIMLNKGDIVQTGHYDELIAQPGPFADFARRQLL